MDIIIRKGNASDFDHIFMLIKEFAAFQKTPGKVKITPAQMLDGEDLFQCFVACTDDGSIVGFASFFFAYYSWSGKALYLDDLYVKENYRGRKVGSSLLTAIIDLARKEQCKKVRWQVSSWNSAAISFYKKLGAVIDDVEINCDLEL